MAAPVNTDRRSRHSAASSRQGFYHAGNSSDSTPGERAVPTEEIAMRLKRHVVVVAGLLGLIAIGIVTHGEGLIVRSQADGVWTAHLRVVETELARGRIDVAVRVWHDAYGAALESRSWESKIAVGDAFMQIGHAAGTPRRRAHERARRVHDRPDPSPAHPLRRRRAPERRGIPGARRIAPSPSNASTSPRSSRRGMTTRSNGSARRGNAGRRRRRSRGREESRSCHHR